MFTFHIYLGDTCIGSVEAYSPENAITMYCLRSGGDPIGLTAVLVTNSAPNFPIPADWCRV
jgi:hypothetical protein